MKKTFLILIIAIVANLSSYAQTLQEQIKECVNQTNTTLPLPIGGDLMTLVKLTYENNILSYTFDINEDLSPKGDEVIPWLLSDKEILLGEMRDTFKSGIPFNDALKTVKATIQYTYVGKPSGKNFTISINATEQ